MARRAHAGLLAASTLLAAASLARGADTEAHRLASEAMALCHRADSLPRDERVAMLERGLALAEQAVERDEAHARAHFAVFCTLGRLVEQQGLGWRTLGMARRVRHAIDRAVALAPDDVDALVGKGALLLRLPGLLGGDEREAERCFTRALELDPLHPRARAYADRLRAGRSGAPARVTHPALSSALSAE